MIDAAVAVSGLTKVFPVPFHRQPIVAVRDLDLRIQAGEVYGLLGPNGSGKSTTLKIILGLVSPTRGHTEIFGRDSRMVESREAVGFLPENPYFYKYLTGEETLRFFGKLCGLSGARLKKRISELLELVGLTECTRSPLGHIFKRHASARRARASVDQRTETGPARRADRRRRSGRLAAKFGTSLSILNGAESPSCSRHICSRKSRKSATASPFSRTAFSVREGQLEELIAIENQTEFVVADASSHLVKEIESLIGRSNAQLIERRRSTTTLERLFLEATKNDEHGINEEIRMTNPIETRNSAEVVAHAFVIRALSFLRHSSFVPFIIRIADGHATSVFLFRSHRCDHAEYADRAHAPKSFLCPAHLRAAFDRQLHLHGAPHFSAGIPDSERCLARRDVNLYFVAGHRRDRATHSARHRGPHHLYDSRQAGAAISSTCSASSPACSCCLSSACRHERDAVRSSSLYARTNYACTKHSSQMSRRAARTS